MDQPGDGPQLIINNDSGDSKMPVHNPIYITAHARAYHWASKALVLRAKGELAAAKVAGKKVRLWLRKIATLEMGGKRPSEVSGRAGTEAA
jgi:hypothetical protein